MGGKKKKGVNEKRKGKIDVLAILLLVEEIKEKKRKESFNSLP